MTSQLRLSSLLAMVVVKPRFRKPAYLAVPAAPARGGRAAGGPALPSDRARQAVGAAGAAGAGGAGGAIRAIRAIWAMMRAAGRRLPWADLGAQAVFAVTAVVLLFQALAYGAVRWQDDTKYFYFPLLSTLAAALKAGHLPLWEPGIFGGYPLFADGEAGMLYPLHVLALRLLEPGQALVVLRLVRFYLAGAFTYAFLRTTGAGRSGALAGGLAFMLSGFMVAQVVHENLDSGMIWLPLTLHFVERALRTPGPRRPLLASFAGVALAMQALAVHVQVCLFTGLAVLAYLGWRVLCGPVPSPPKPLSLWERGRMGMGIGAAMGATAAGLCAVQLLPLLDLAERSARGHGISLTAATINSVTPFRLLTILFPHLLTYPDGASFGYWVPWEVTVDVGLPTLFLAAIALLARRDRYVAFFALLAGLALVLATGRYGPPWVVQLTQEILGRHGLRSPGRFAFLWSFGMAALAGYGVDWLERSLWARRSGAAVTTGQRWPRRASFSRRWAAPAGVAGLGLATAGLLAAPLLARRWLLEHPVAAREWLQRHYFAFDRTVQLRTSVDEVYHSLLVALHPATPATRVWLVSLLGTTLLVALWLVARRLPTGAPARLVRPALRGATLLLVALPLLASREHIHPAVPTTALEPQSGAVAYLRQQLSPPGAAPEARPLYRVYTSQPVYLYRFDVEPNVLLPLGIQEAGGYSSLDNDTHLAYAWAAETSQGRMLDVWNARYYLWPNRPDLLPSYELTSFHPQRPLVSGTAANAGAKATFRVPGVRAQDIRVLATLRDAWEVAPGTVVAWIVATDDGGREMRWPLRAGVELAEATAPPAPPGSTAPPAAPSTTRPLSVFTWKEPAPQGRTIDAHLYYSKLPLEAPRTIVRLALEPVLVAGAQQPILRLYGLGVGQPDWSVHNVVWFDRERYTQVYAGEQVRVYRNEQALPRAYLVPLAVSAPRERHLKEMAERAFDPARMLLVDPGPPHASGVTAAAPAPLEGPSEALGVKSWLSGESRVPSPESRVGGGIETRNIGLGTRDQGLGTSNAVRPVGVTADPSGRDAVSAAGRTTVTRYARDRVELTVDVERPAGAWLFLADQSDPNWRAYVDGAPRPVRVANALFRAVAVPPGHHVVEFRYEPAPLRWGALVSATTGGLVLLAAVAGAAVGPWRARRRNPER